MDRNYPFIGRQNVASISNCPHPPALYAANSMLGVRKNRSVERAVARVALALSSRASAFVGAVAIGSAIALARIPFQPNLGATAPFILSWPAIMLAAFVGGFWPAMIVAGVGLAVGQWALRDGASAALGPVAILIYLAFTLVIAGAGEGRKRGIRRAEAYGERLAQTQAQLQQMARLTAMGEMAGSLAHELNQPLTAATNYLTVARDRVVRGDMASAELADLLARAAAQTARAGEVVGRIRASVERTAIEAAPLSLGGMIREAVDIALAAHPANTPVIRYDLDRACDRVVADRIQVQQVVLNLVRNAMEAMDAAARRELRIECHPGEAGFVEISVADTGPGLTPDVASRLFQPFVSSKPDGMGIGLSISNSIVEAHGGRMWADAAEGGGAAFHFSLRRG